MIIIIIAAMVIITAGATIAEAATLNVPTDYSTIQAAIDAAADGEEVLVASGTYNENISINNKAITVRTTDGAVIDGGGNGSVVTFLFCEGPSSVFDGFTIQSGSAGSWGGGGIYCNNSSTMISNCTIKNNWADEWGGGILCDASWPTITNCIINNNTAGNRGGGIACYNSSSPAITNCIINSNTAITGGGIQCELSSSPVFTNCIISKNTANNLGGGISFLGSTSMKIVNCTISDNYSYSYGGGIYSYSSSPLTLVPKVINSIIWGNTEERGNDQIYLGGMSSISITYSDIEGGWTGTGNINADPLFLGNGDFHLTYGSPCIDSGTDDTVTYPDLPGDDFEGDLRPQELGYDMGADERACVDADYDGYYDIEGCSTAVDCDDSDHKINPGENENGKLKCLDGLDNNCDGLIDCEDPDCSGKSWCN
jgi:parallel beta-helix repeat protein